MCIWYVANFKHNATHLDIVTTVHTAYSESHISRGMAFMARLLLGTLIGMHGQHDF